MRGLSRFERDRPTFFIYEALVYLYVGCSIAWGILLLYVNVPHTYFWNLSRPGTLFSLRYRSLLSIALIVSCLKVMLPLFVRALLRFRKNRECSWAWLVLSFMVAFVDLLILFYIVSQVAGANRAGNFYNVLCNDPAYCCPFYMNPNCQNDRACTSPAIAQSELQRPALCWALFAFSLAGATLSLTLVLWPFFTRNKPYIEEEEDEEEEDEGYLLQGTSYGYHKKDSADHRVGGSSAEGNFVSAWTRSAYSNTAVQLRKRNPNSVMTQIPQISLN